jgi:hypothetical protein
VGENNGAKEENVKNGMRKDIRIEYKKLTFRRQQFRCTDMNVF